MPASPPQDAIVLASQHASTIVLTPQKFPTRPAGFVGIISLVGKGGSGKSTTAIQLSGIAANLGYRPLILDTDPQQSATDWRSLREDTSIAVWSCRPHQVDDLVKRANKAGFDLILIDNAPVRNDASAQIAALAALSLVMVRPSTLDLVVGLEWIAWLKALNRPFAAAIGAAPSIRLGIEAPFVRDARRAMRLEADRVWKGQISLRHAVIESTGTGQTLMEVDPRGQAASEYIRLWNGVMQELGHRP